MNLQKVSAAFDSFHEWVARKTGSYLETKTGKLILSSLIFLGPIMFLPTIYLAWTAENIEVLRTPTWLTNTVVNFAFWLSLARKGDWQTRLSMIIWVILMAAITLATWIR
ncbi:hypothetical protein K2Q00_03940 [Patescibacteria group bacterium]|nr:hypothetical protein [Patescibacteria group bacterium]